MGEKGRRGGERKGTKKPSWVGGWRWEHVSITGSSHKFTVIIPSWIFHALKSLTF